MPGKLHHLELEETPLRRMESRIYAFEAAVYDQGRDLVAEESAELEALQDRLLQAAHKLAASRKPSFDQMLSLVLLGRCLALAEHLYQAGKK